MVKWLVCLATVLKVAGSNNTRKWVPGYGFGRFKALKGVCWAPPFICGCRRHYGALPSTVVRLVACLLRKQRSGDQSSHWAHSLIPLFC